MRYNIEVTIECRTEKAAKDLAAFILYSGFMPFIDGTMISLIAKNVDRVALEYLVEVIEEDDRVISSSFHKTPF